MWGDHACGTLASSLECGASSGCLLRLALHGGRATWTLGCRAELGRTHWNPMRVQS